MKKLSSTKTDKLLISFAIRVILSSIASIIFFSLISSKLILVFDIDVENAKIFSLIICIITALIVSFISTYGFKNNGALLGIISELPLIFYSLVNTIFHNHNIILLLIKIIIIALIGAFIGTITVNKSKKIRVK